MPYPFIGRKYELDLLDKLLERHVACLAVIKGRRRIGKSRLIQEFAKGFTFYRFSGIPPTSETTIQSQLDEFSKQLSAETGLPKVSADDWSTLFHLLADKVKTDRVIVLFDEISWMGSKDPDFLGKFKNAWDMHFKQNPKLIFFLCGSVSSWIDKNILSSTGFVGRISFRLTLKELPLPDCNQFWLRKDSYISSYEKLKILSVTGGIPRYLEEINPSETSDENIRRLCFTEAGLLVHEFNDIFTDLFPLRNALYQKIVKALANGPKEVRGVSDAIGKAYTGRISEYLDDLEKAGFISRDYTWHLKTGKLSKLSQFRLSDNYVRFYIKYIEPVAPKINQGAYDFTSQTDLPGWDTIMGYQCENLVLKNRQYIKEQLSIKPNDVITDNPYFQRKTEKKPGCQIDYLIQAKHGNLFLCEFKFSRNPIGKQVITEVQQKIERMILPRGFSIRPVLIHVNGVDDEVVHSGFFSRIIDFGKILASNTGNKER